MQWVRVRARRRERLARVSTVEPRECPPVSRSGRPYGTHRRVVIGARGCLRMVFLYPRSLVGGPSSAAVGAGTPRRVVERRRRRADGARERESGAEVTDRVRACACAVRDRETARPRDRAFVNSFAHSPTAATRRARARRRTRVVDDERRVRERDVSVTRRRVRARDATRRDGDDSVTTTRACAFSKRRRRGRIRDEFSTTDAS